MTITQLTLDDLKAGKQNALKFYETFYGTPDVESLWFQCYLKGLDVTWKLCLTDNFNYFADMYLTDSKDENVEVYNGYSFYTTIKEGVSELLDSNRLQLTELQTKYNTAKEQVDYFAQADDEIMYSLSLGRVEMLNDQISKVSNLIEDLYENYYIAKLRANQL